MNVEQLENILKQIDLIEMLIEDDRQGCLTVYDKLKKFKGAVTCELKNEVWKRYLEVAV